LFGFFIAEKRLTRHSGVAKGKIECKTGADGCSRPQERAVFRSGRYDTKTPGVRRDLRSSVSHRLAFLIQDTQPHKIMALKSSIFIFGDMPYFSLEILTGACRRSRIIAHIQDVSHLDTRQHFRVLPHQDAHGLGCHIPDLELVRHGQAVYGEFHAVIL